MNRRPVWSFLFSLQLKNQRVSENTDCSWAGMFVDLFSHQGEPKNPEEIFREFCSIFSPCENDGICSDDLVHLYGHNCSCPFQVHEKHCQIDDRPCRTNPCFHGGISFPVWRLTRQRLFRHLSRNIPSRSELFLFPWSRRSMVRKIGESLLESNLSEQRPMPSVGGTFVLWMSSGKLFGRGVWNHGTTNCRSSIFV